MLLDADMYFLPLEGDVVDVGDSLRLLEAKLRIFLQTPRYPSEILEDLGLFDN